MTGKFDPAITEAEENLLIDYQFLLQEVLTQKGVTISQLAEKAGLSKGRISQIMGAEANPTVKTFARLFHALGERVIPKLEPRVTSLKKATPAAPGWAEFEHTAKLDFAPPNRDCEIIALIKEAKKSAGASNDNGAPVVVMDGNKFTVPKAA
jgi:transcriptional regulator with XRE-family HTH domain